MTRTNAEVFLTVVRLGSYRKAADKLGYTQAGISYIIKNMEESIGLKLFEREFGGVKLTPEGKHILPEIKRMYDCEQSLETKIDALKGLTTGQIKILSFNTVIVCWLPEILRGFKEQYPGIDIEILSCENNIQAMQMLKNHEADCGFLDIEQSEDIQLIHIRQEPDVVVIAENHPLANATEFTIDDMKQYPFIGYPEDDAPCVYKKAQEKGLQFNRIMTIRNDYGSFSMISKNLGFGIYPKSIAEKCMFPVKILSSNLDSYTSVSLGFLAYDSLSLAAKAFVDYAASFDYE